MDVMYSFLKWQFKCYFGEGFNVLVEWSRFFDGVSDVYKEFDIDCVMLE